MIANITQVTINTNSIPVISVSAGVQGPPGPTGSTGTVDFSAVASNIIPDTDNTRTLGTPSKRWNHVYVGPGSITIGDAVLSLDGGKITSSTGFKLTNSTVADALPAQTGNSGKYLTTNGTALSWATVTSGTTDYNNLTNKPTIPTSFSSLVNGSKTVSLGTDSILTLPAPLALLTTVSQLANDTAKIYRATNSTDLAAIQTAWDNWYGYEQMFREMAYQDSQISGGSGSTRPWAGLPSWEAYPLIMNYLSNPPGPGGGGSPLPPPSNLGPAAKTAQDSYLAYKQLVSSIDIVNGNKTISFNNTGLLSLPGKLEFKDTANAKIILKTIDPLGYVVEDPTLDKTWTFNANGSLTFPNDTTQTTAFTGTGNVGFRNDTIFDLAGLAINNSNTSTASTAGISIPANGSGTLSITNSSSTWGFGSNGNTTFPTGLVLGAPRGSGTVNFTSAIDKEFQIETGTASYSKLWRFETNGNTTLPSGLTFRKNGTPYSTITADLDKVLQIETQTSSGVKQWSLGTDGWLTLPNNGVVQSNTLIALSSFNDTNNIARVICQSVSNAPQVNLKTITSTGAQKDWVFSSTGALTFPNGTLKITDSVISNLNVVGSLSTGSQIQVGNGTAADTGIIISNGTTDDSTSSRSLINVNGTTASMMLQVANSLGGGATLTGQQLVEVGSSNVVIGLRVINAGAGAPVTTFSGWTFNGQSRSLTLPEGSTIDETTEIVTVTLDQFTAGGYSGTRVFTKVSDTQYELSPTGPYMTLISGIWRLKVGPATYYDSTDLITWNPIAGSSPAPVGTLGTVASMNLGVGSNTWALSEDGALTLPAGGTITEGGGLTGAIRLTPAGGANAYQALLIYPTAGGDGDHVHLTAGGGTTELYLGNDNHYVKLVNGGNVEVRAFQPTSPYATAVWGFGTDGAVSATKPLIINVPNGVPSSVGAIGATTGSWELNPRSNLATTGGSGSGLTVNVTETGGYASAIAIATAGTGYLDGELITVTSGSSSASFIIAVTGNRSWTFGTDGKLTSPGNLQVNGGKIILNTGGNAYVESVDYGVNSANSALNIFGGPYQKINLRAGFGTQATWTLATDGRTTFPNGTVPAHSYGAAGDKEGMVVFDDTYIYYCTADYVNNSTDIWKRTAHGAGTW